jgi:hypothetical protein
MVWIAEHLRIFSNAGEGLVRQVKHNMKGHGTYILGRAQDQGALWYYFPVLLTIKLTVPFLLAPLALAAGRVRGLLNWATVTAAVLAAFSLTYRVQIGIRFLLPCIALAGVGLAAAAVQAARAAADGRGRFTVRLAAGAGVAWMAVASFAVWPDGLRYVNELWGGRRDGYRLVSDSNYDWGQGLPELARWQWRHGVGELNVWYFGTDPALKVLPVHEVPFHTLVLKGDEDVRERVAGRWLAVGATVLYGHGTTDGHRTAAAYLRTQRPVAAAGPFLIFDFTQSSGRQVTQAAGR